LVDSYNYATDRHVEFGGQAAAAIQKAIDRHAARTGADKKEAAE
jgi:hypothetical protein